MKVIAAGFPKTGTKSLNAALVTLGFSVYDFIENGYYLCDEWRTIFDRGWTTETFRNMYEDIDAVIDVPACYYWEEIHKAFPDSKIILTIRDEDEWVKSFDNHLRVTDGNLAFHLMQWFSPLQKKVLKVTGYGTGLAVFGDERLFEAKLKNRRVNKELMKLKYRAHNAYVLQNAPKDKFLIFKVSDGWEPLCNFLGVPVPDEPFPHKNIGGSVIQESIEVHPIVRKMIPELFTSLAILGSTTLLFGFLVYKKGFHGIMLECGSALQSAGKFLRLL